MIWIRMDKVWIRIRSTALEECAVSFDKNCANENTTLPIIDRKILYKEIAQKNQLLLTLPFQNFKQANISVCSV